MGQFPDPPAELLVSMEADLFSLRDPRDADLIDGSIGEASPFHQTFGYYAHGVGEETAVLPDGWQSRLIPLASPNTAGTTGLCLEVHDLAVAKLVAGRAKDLEFINGLFRNGMASPYVLSDRLSHTTLDESVRSACAARLARILHV